MLKIAAAEGALEVGKVHDRHRRVGVAQHGRRLLTEFDRRLLADHRVAGLLPGGQATQQDSYIGYSVLSRDERRTGALFFGRSGAVEDG